MESHNEIIKLNAVISLQEDYIAFLKEAAGNGPLVIYEAKFIGWKYDEIIKYYEFEISEAKEGKL